MPDEEFLRFLCETIHPAVSTDAEGVEKLKGLINEHLFKDGWELHHQAFISGRPVFAGMSALQFDAYAAESVKVISQNINSHYVVRQVTRMQSCLDREADVAIGTAKQFLETICKTILRERNVTFEANEKMPQLIRLATGTLDLIAQHIANASAATEKVKRLLSNLSSVSDGLAELRNLHGTGHGKEADDVGLHVRHARLAFGAATALAVFLWETHSEE